jgi:hypothetical protein
VREVSTFDGVLCRIRNLEAGEPGHAVVAEEFPALALMIQQLALEWILLSSRIRRRRGEQPSEPVGDAHGRGAYAMIGA